MLQMCDFFFSMVLKMPRLWVQSPYGPFTMVELHDPCGSLSAQNILWFCDWLENPKPSLHRYQAGKTTADHPSRGESSKCQSRPNRKGTWEPQQTAHSCPQILDSCKADFSWWSPSTSSTLSSQGNQAWSGIRGAILTAHTLVMI